MVVFLVELNCIMYLFLFFWGGGVCFGFYLDRVCSFDLFCLNEIDIIRGLL